MSRITDILTDVWNNGSLHGDTEKFMGTEAAEQALLAWLDECIGLDQVSHSVPLGMPENIYNALRAQDQLRAEIRRKVGL